jgi:hypothetical protein
MKRKYLDLVFTNHAINRLYNRGITQEKAYETFKNPNGQLAGKIPGSTKFYKNYGKQRVEVIVKKNEKGEWIVLSCWSKFKEKAPYLKNKFAYQKKEPLLQKLIGTLVRKIFKS